LHADSGVSKSALNRLLNGHSSPSFALVSLLTGSVGAATKQGRRSQAADPARLGFARRRVSDASVCSLAGCWGCLPTSAYDENEKLKPEYRDVKPGQWSLPHPSELPRPQPKFNVAQPQELPPPRNLPPLLVPVKSSPMTGTRNGEEVAR
jgi:hypothetical protein